MVGAGSPDLMSLFYFLPWNLRDLSVVVAVVDDDDDDDGRNASAEFNISTVRTLFKSIMRTI